MRTSIPCAWASAAAFFCWRFISQGVVTIVAMPTRWQPSWRTSQAVQSVRRVQSSGARAASVSAIRWYSVAARRIEVGREICGRTTPSVDGGLVAVMVAPWCR